MERIDDLQLNGLKLIQDSSTFCFGVDAVILADFASGKSGKKVLDLCTGNGIIPILLSAKTDAEKIYGIEVQQKAFDLAKRSVELNQLSDRLNIINGDLKEITSLTNEREFDLITCNPPYMSGGGGLVNPTDEKAIARHEILCSLEDVIRVSKSMLKYRGRLCLVHRPQRLCDIIYLMRSYDIEPKRMRLVYPYVGKDANLVLVEGMLGANVEMKAMQPLYVYNSDGSYTDEINKIYGRDKG